MRLTRARTALSVPLLGLALLAPALPTSTASGAATARVAVTGTLQEISPEVYVGGQLLTFRGNLGVSGERRIHLESRAKNRPGAQWVAVPRSRNRTAADGSFDFEHPAPSMFNKVYRVVGGQHATEGRLLNARSQDLVLYTNDDPVAGRSFQIVVDTTPGPHEPRTSPAHLDHRPDLPPPVFRGRELTLQRRVGSDGWTTIGSTTTDDRGLGFFRVTVAQAGDVVYRVRQEDYPQAGGPPIGWFPSFPTPIHVAATAAAAREAAAAAPATTTAEPAADTGTESATVARGGAEPNPTAAERYGWRPSQWDFAWIGGESLTSPPYRGRDPQGWWLDSSDGSGRVAPHNGGLSLESSREYEGPGDFGTTTATMQDNPSRYGRWEVRVRAKANENNAKDYRQRIELVPARAADYCGGKRNITIGEFRAHGSKVKFGVKSARANRKWRAVRRVGALDNRVLALAVEVTKRHISWFHDGKVIGTAPRGAVPRVPLTLRLTQQGGRGLAEMNSTEAIYDWMRGFSLKRGKKVDDGPRLRTRRLRGSC